MPSAESRSVALVVNSGARTGADAMAEASRLLQEADIGPVTEHPVGPEDDLGDVLDRALADRPDLLIIGGGDGSVTCAAGRAAAASVVLGVIPLGTANDFARTLEIPDDLAGAVATIVEGRVADVDLGRLDGAPFLNLASIGLATEVAETLSSRMKKVMGPVAYAVATVRAYRRHRPFSARLEFPDGDHDTVELDDLLQLAVGNGRYYGGGQTVAPDASVDDQLLDVYAIERGTFREHVSIARRMRDGGFVEHDRVLHRTTRHVLIHTDEALAVNLDGEVAAQTPCEVGIDTNGLRVVIPRESTAARDDS